VRFIVNELLKKGNNFYQIFFFHVKKTKFIAKFANEEYGNPVAFRWLLARF
tara:strand:+ start:81 stop:233 length:153 start_codon:yes stop_codon:yes gene_type:complete